MHELSLLVDLLTSLLIPGKLRINIRSIDYMYIYIYAISYLMWEVGTNLEVVQFACLLRGSKILITAW